MVAEEGTFRGDQGTSLIKVVCSYPMMKETMVTNHKNGCLPHLFGNLQNRFSHFLQPAMCRQRHVEGWPLTTHVEGVPINEDQWPEHVRWSCVLIPAEAIGPLRRECEVIRGEKCEVVQGEKVLVRPSQLCGKGSDVDRDGWFEARCLCSDARASFWKHTTEQALRTRVHYGVELPFCPLRSEMSISDPTLQRRQTHRCWCLMSGWVFPPPSMLKLRFLFPRMK